MNHSFYPPVKCEHHPPNSLPYTKFMMMLDCVECFSQTAMCSGYLHKLYIYIAKETEQSEKERKSSGVKWRQNVTMDSKINK